MKKINVLFNTTKSAGECPGGGIVLISKSKQYLEREGIKVELFEEGKTNLGDFDIFHNFSLHRNCLKPIMAAKKAGLHIAISPIYWPSLAFVLHSGKPLHERLKMIAAELSNTLPFSAVRKMLNAADVVLPSSLAEKEMLQKRFSLPKEKISIVYNGVDERFKGANSKLFEKKFQMRDFVLYVGKIEERKNVLSLIKAMKGIDAKLVVVGNANEGNKVYLRKCRQGASGNVVFLSAMPHDSEMLASAYAACKVFCLPSWYETPGLAALEAGLAGANIVVTREGPTKEYFSDMAAYVNPSNLKDIREKIVLQLQKPKTGALSSHIQKNFLWQNTAEQTKEAYEKVLKGAAV
ncbi:MAG: glycosyltransferase [Candidatus Diapherotrites archaeon]|nr:glycosyltransferase [Candidatus Diapherotrites archaeon]